MQNRRKFLRDCSLAAATAACFPAALAQPQIAAANRPGGPGFAEFLGQVNTTFAVRTGAKSISLELVHAGALPAMTVPEVAGNENFALTFHGPGHSPLPQDTYPFDHPQLGRLAIFIVPVGQPVATHCRYQAVFSRPADAAELARQLSRAPKRSFNC
jgi:hypothetical protein